MGNDFKASMWRGSTYRLAHLWNFCLGLSYLRVEKRKSEKGKGRERSEKESRDQE